MLAGLWALFIAACSSTVIGPRAFVGGASHAVGVSRAGFQSFWDRTWWIFVKGFHALEFAILALLLWRAGARPLVAFALAVGWAALDEWHQTFVPARGGRVTDVLIDVGGAAAMLLVVALLRRRTQRG